MHQRQMSEKRVLQVPLSVVAMVSAILIFCGVLIGRGYPSANMPKELSSSLNLRADAAARGKNVSLASGAVDSTVEGLFVLDHLTGNLECWVLNTRNGSVAARYRTNVNEELGLPKTGDADYVLTTGRFIFEGGVQANRRPGRCICYVADGNSGKVVGYGLRFNRQAMLQGEPQTGELFVVCRGVTRGGILERDQ